MIERVFTLTHNEAPASLNAGGAGSRRHWSVGYKEKQRWQEIYTGLMLEQRIPRGMVFCTAAATIAWKQRLVGGRPRDSTNYIASIVKPLADVLAPPSHLFYGKGNAKTAVLNTAPRWLEDDTDDFFKWDGVTFEYPDPWVHGPLVRAVLTVRLRARYEDPAPRADQGLPDDS